MASSLLTPEYTLQAYVAQTSYNTMSPANSSKAFFRSRKIIGLASVFESTSGRYFALTFPNARLDGLGNGIGDPCMLSRGSRML